MTWVLMQLDPRLVLKAESRETGILSYFKSAIGFNINWITFIT